MEIGEIAAKHNLPLIHVLTVRNIVRKVGPVARKDRLLYILREDAQNEPAFAPGFRHLMELIHDWTDDDVANLTLDLQVNDAAERPSGTRKK